MKELLTVFMFLYATIVQGTDYYVSSGGDDNKAGTSPALAWKSLAKVQSESANLRPGDRVLFRKGDTFYGHLSLKDLHGIDNNFIVIGAYGSGPNPVLDGSVKVSDWAIDKGNIWTANLSSHRVKTSMKGVYFKGQFLNKARHPNLDAPNQGYLTEDVGHDFNDKSVIKDHDLPKLFTDHYWQGAEVVSRTREWLLDISTMNRQQESTIYLGEKLTYGIPKGFGYFFQNSYKALDKDKEWYYDPSTDKLYLYFDNIDPNDHAIEVAYHDTVLGLTNSSYVKIENLTLQKGRSNTVLLTNVNHCHFISNQILLSAENGMSVTDAESLIIENNTINHTQNNALQLSANNTLIQDNEVKNTALVAGMGTTGNGQYIACFISGKNNTFRYNEIINTGYNAIHFGSGPWTIENNLVDHFNMVKSDGGGIYCFQNTEKGTKVRNNIILNGGGNSANAGVAPSPYAKVRGLYVDGGSSNILYEGNTVAFCGEGMLMNSCSNITVNHNTFIGSRETSLRVTWHGNIKQDARNILVKNNIFIAANDHFPIYAIETKKDDIELFGNFDNNTLSQPLSSSSPRNLYVFYTRENIIKKGKSALDDQYYSYSDLKEWIYGKHDVLPYVHYARYSTKNPGSNIVANATMDASFQDKNSWLRLHTSSPSFHMERTSEEGINGNSLKATFSNPEAGDVGYVIQKNIPVTKDAFYQVNFDIKGTTNASIVFKFLTGCCGRTHTIKPFQTSTSTTNYQYIFKAAETTKEGRIMIDIKATPGEVYLDNFTIKKVTVEETEFEDVVKLEYNASKQIKKIELKEKYVSIDGSPVTQIINLKPYESIVLLKVAPQ